MGVRILSDRDNDDNTHLECSACGGRPDASNKQEAGEPCYLCGCGTLIEAVEDEPEAEIICTRCGIEHDDPRAKQACAAVDSPSPYHTFQREKAGAL